jgi:hypothetical protein
VSQISVATVHFLFPDVGEREQATAVSNPENARWEKGSEQPAGEALPPGAPASETLRWGETFTPQEKSPGSETLPGM